MSKIPGDIDFRTSSTSAAARARRVEPIMDRGQGFDVSVALYCVGAFDGFCEDNELASLENEDIAVALIAAARTLMAVSEEIRKTDPSSQEVSDGLAMHAAVAFAMHGNFPSARSSILAATPLYRSATTSRRLAWAVCDPAAIEEIITISDSNTEEANFYRSWKKTLQLVSVTTKESTEELLKSFPVSPNQSDAALQYSTEVAFRQGFRLAIAHLKNTASFLPEVFIQRLIESGRWTLLPPQRKLLVEAGLAQRTTNSLLNLPTSTGKTLLAEACIAASLSRGAGTAIYVAPYVAIGDQVVTALKSHMPEDIGVIPMFGGFKNDLPSTESGVKQVLVMTPERFDGWLRASNSISMLRLVVMDELHCIENGSRGARLEGLITRLRLLQDAGAAVRLVSLSAVLPDAKGLREWLSVSDADFHREGWRPTARRLALCEADGTLTWMYGADALKPAQYKFGTATTKPIKISLPERVVPFRGRFVPDKDSIAAGRNVAAIAQDLAGRLNGPGLIVCPRRIDTRRIAAALAEVVFAPESSNTALKAVADEIARKHSWLLALSKMLRQGVAYHNSTLPHDVRRVIEQALRDGHITFVVATTTLAEGADLPFRWTLISHWLRGVFADAKPLNPLTFRNIAGRSGRAGSYSEGDTVIFENLLGPENATLKVPANRKAAIEKILNDNSPLKSSIRLIEENFEEREVQSIIASFSSQLMAAIPENPLSEDIVARFSQSSYAAKSGYKDILSNVYKVALTEMLDSSETGGAMATKNSPVKLTELGVAANLSGFSPGTIRVLLVFLNKDEFPSDPAKLISSSLAHCAEVPEQNSTYLIKLQTKDKHKQFVKLTDIESVVSSWLAEVPTREIFESLPTFLKTKSNEDTVEAQFEQFVGFADSVLRSFSPWLLRAMDTLKGFGSYAAGNIEWRLLAERMEKREHAPTIDPSF